MCAEGVDPDLLRMPLPYAPAGASAGLPSPPLSPLRNKHDSELRSPRPEQPAIRSPAALRLPPDLALLLTPPLSPVDEERAAPPPLAWSSRFLPLPRAATPRPASPLNPFQSYLLAQRTLISKRVAELPNRNPHLARFVPKRRSSPGLIPQREDSFEDNEVRVWFVTPVDTSLLVGGEDDDAGVDLRRWLAGKRTAKSLKRSRRREAGKSTLRIEIQISLDLSLPQQSLAPHPHSLKNNSHYKHISMPTLPALAHPKPLKPFHGRSRAPSLPSIFTRSPSLPISMGGLSRFNSDSDTEPEEHDLHEPLRSPSPDDAAGDHSLVVRLKHRRRHSDSIVRRLEEEERQANVAELVESEST